MRNKRDAPASLWALRVGRWRGAYGVTEDEHEAICRHEEGLRREVLAPHGHEERVKLYDEDVEELRRIAADAEHTAHGCMELHRRKEKVRRRSGVEVANSARATSSARLALGHRAEVSGGDRQQHDCEVEQVVRLPTELHLEPCDQHASKRAAGEDDGVDAILGPDAVARLDARVRNAEDERGDREGRVHADCEQRAGRRGKAHVGRSDLREAVDVGEEAADAQRLVEVVLVLYRKELAVDIAQRPHRRRPTGGLQWSGQGGDV